MVVIKEMNVQEIEYHKKTICELLHSCLSWKGVSYQVSERKYFDLLNYISNNKGFLFGSIENGKLVGICWCYRNFQIVGEELHIAYLACLTKYQHRGIGYKMILKVEELAKIIGVNSISLNVEIANKVALEFYQKCGFQADTAHLRKEII